ncbi:hypothetical protein K431DRAFT_310959 [Polychaeton citri CBS 116435]|uniref:Glycine zipper 2TM domain-containing protein n=1 Tax=Polychaeton citri CBS 116435 TaxID=1314669 RepID=A0A9P4QF35_9PEZI|nr:hypothetical protein K431DRAFT_310959 [Polychaeton citri CBS 116435]
MEEALELTATGIDHATEKYGDRIYDGVSSQFTKYRHQPNSSQRGGAAPPSEASVGPPNNRRQRNSRQRNSLPSPERDDTAARYYTAASSAATPPTRRDDSLERESQRSARVIREYESEADDPKRVPDGFLPVKDSRRDSARMSYAGDYGRTRSQPPDATRYYEDDGYGSDYDERTGARTRASGKGYGANGYDDKYDDRYRNLEVEPYREYYETERYRGLQPAGNFNPRTSRGSFGAAAPLDPPPAGSNAPGYGAGTVAPYSRKSRTEVSRRSKSRGRRSYSGSRSRSRSRSKSGVRGKVDEWFDPTAKGIGIGIAGAVVGGLAGREFGGERHRKRDMVIGALIGGLGANAAENKWREYRHPEERNSRREVYEYDDGGRRPRSSVR